ncbi:MAG: hypothetical protein NTV46_04100, partial [Verrucomicrobia bacterium]|nr:hypothetical protein [Verrucomicrobiota bacterium]
MVIETTPTHPFVVAADEEFESVGQAEVWPGAKSEVNANAKLEQHGIVDACFVIGNVGDIDMPIHIIHEYITNPGKN